MEFALPQPFKKIQSEQKFLLNGSIKSGFAVFVVSKLNQELQMSDFEDFFLLF